MRLAQGGGQSGEDGRARQRGGGEGLKATQRAEDRHLTSGLSSNRSVI